MAEKHITLLDGLKIGDDVLHHAVLRPPTAGDVLDAQEASERVVYDPRDGSPSLVSSSSRVAVEVLRRQIVRIGDVSGPLDMGLLRTLSPRDLGLLQAEALVLESASVARETAERGRADRVGGAGAQAHPGPGE